VLTSKLILNGGGDGPQRFQLRKSNYRERGGWKKGGKTSSSSCAKLGVGSKEGGIMMGGGGGFLSLVGGERDKLLSQEGRSVKRGDNRGGAEEMKVRHREEHF